ncbi:hypothetical protein AeRB84_004711 [Aphanomyces euteiches]|nr:hypothetical protein AeRB84_008234 [Aphanomyces euteiches]KAH9150608.1 hypothetical protein AeRB84_006574 [Aphanomyces euteiches]KAH9152591.1 hypothetical protein AeRB84_004996 [Aphanomyces euteiches]KAH9152947.1 hypothetical protein AeRB84_004711 [Aphanomyces euteiches]
MLDPDDAHAMDAMSSVASICDDDESLNEVSCNAPPRPNYVKTVIFQLPKPVDKKVRARRKQKRTRAQVQKILGWYTPQAIQNLLETDQAEIDRKELARAAEKVKELQERQRIQTRRKQPQETNEGVTLIVSPDPISPSTESNPTCSLPSNTAVVLSMEQEAAELEARITQLENRNVASSASTIDFTINSTPTNFNFTPPSTQVLLESGPPSSLGFERPIQPTRILSRSLLELYRQVNSVPANEDSYADRRECDQFLEHYRAEVRAEPSATRIQAAWRMHARRKVFIRWKISRARRQRAVLTTWTMIHRVDKMVRTRVCRHAFSEWAEEVECNIKLRLIELKLLQHSSTLYQLPTLVKNLFVTSRRGDDWLEGPQSLARRTPTATQRSIQVVNPAYASVEASASESTANRVYRLRLEMDRARAAVARKFVQTTFLRWKAAHQAHARVATNAEMCLRRAFRMAFMQRPAWVGERVLVAFHMWYRLTVFNRHKRLCLEVPIFSTPLPQWDQWLQAYRIEQIRILEAEAKGPLAWLRRYFCLLRRYYRQRQEKKRANTKAKMHYARKLLSGLFQSWHQDTLVHLETRGRLKQVFHAWRFYALQRQHCRPQKRKVMEQTYQRRMTKSWEAWKEASARHEMAQLDRLSKFLQPHVCPKLCQILFLWADIASQRIKHTVFLRWKSSLYRRKNFAKLCNVFLAWRCVFKPTNATSLTLTPQVKNLADAVEKALPYMYACDVKVEIEPYALYSFHSSVRDGHISTMEAIIQQDPLIVHCREPVYGNTALHIAVNRSDKRQGWIHQRDVLATLISHGASAFAINYSGLSAIMSTSDFRMRHYLQSKGYGFHAGNSPNRIDIQNANTLTGTRLVGDCRLGTWHSFVPRNNAVQIQARPTRAPFFYVMANRLLNQDRVQAVRQNVQEMIAQNLHKTREMLLRDRALVEDDCILDWVSIVAPGIATVPRNEIVTKDDDEEETTTSFHSTHYFTKEMNNDLEAQLATGFVQQLMTKPVSVKPLEEEVKVLDAMVRSTEKQLLQLERHGAGYRSSDESKKIFASVDEEIKHVQHHRIWTDVRIAVKLAHPKRPPPQSLSEAEIITTLEQTLPSDASILSTLSELIASEERHVQDTQCAADDIASDVQRYQGPYQELLDKYNGDEADNIFSKLVTARLQLDESKMALRVAEKKLRKHQAKLEQLKMVQTLFAGPINEQRTFTEEEYLTLSGLLHLPNHTFDQLAAVRNQLELQLRNLDQEAVDQPEQADLFRTQRKNFRKTAKHLLLQHQVLSHMRRSSSVLRDLKQHKWYVNFNNSATTETVGSIDENDISTQSTAANSISSEVAAVLQQQISPTAKVSTELMKAYRRSSKLLFEAERQLVEKGMALQIKTEHESHTSFVEINPLTGKVDPPPSAVELALQLPKHTATTKDVARLNSTRRATLIVPPTLQGSEQSLLPLQNRKRDEIARAISRGQSVEEHEDTRIEIDADIDVCRRQIWGRQFEFANFATSVDPFLTSESTNTNSNPPSARREAPDSARGGGPMAIWKADGIQASESASDLAFVQKRISERTTVSKKGRTSQNNPTNRSEHSPAKANQSTHIPEHLSSPTSRNSTRVRSAPVRENVSAQSHRHSSSPTSRPPAVNDAPKLLAPHPDRPTEELQTKQSDTNDYVQNNTSNPQDASSSTPTPESVEIELNVTESSSILTEVPETIQPTAAPQNDESPDDVDALLDNFTLFSQTLLRQYGDDARIAFLPGSPHFSSPPNSVLVPLKSMEDIIQCDETFITGRSKRKKKYTKRPIAKQLPAIDLSSLALDGASVLRQAQSMPELPKPPRYIPQEQNAPRGKFPQSHDNRLGRMAHIDLQLFQTNSDFSKPHEKGQLAFQQSTKLQDRPFLREVVPLPLPIEEERPIDLTGVGIRRDKLTQSTPALKAGLQGGHLSKEQRDVVWQSFAEKTMSDAVQQAYAAIYPGAYQSQQNQQHHLEPSKKSDVGTENAIVMTASNTVVKRLDTRKSDVKSTVNGKSNEVCFWQAVEGFKSIQDEAIKGAAFQLAPAKHRRQRRSAEIVQEFLVETSVKPLTWLMQDHPLVVEAIKAQTYTDNPKLFDQAQELVEEHMKATRKRRS